MISDDVALSMFDIFNILFPDDNTEVPVLNSFTMKYKKQLTLIINKKRRVLT